MQKCHGEEPTRNWTTEVGGISPTFNAREICPIIQRLKTLKIGAVRHLGKYCIKQAGRSLSGSG